MAAPKKNYFGGPGSAELLAASRWVGRQDAEEAADPQGAETQTLQCLLLLRKSQASTYKYRYRHRYSYSYRYKCRYRYRHRCRCRSGKITQSQNSAMLKQERVPVESNHFLSGCRARYLSGMCLHSAAEPLPGPQKYVE